MNGGRIILFIVADGHEVSLLNCACSNCPHRRGSKEYYSAGKCAQSAAAPSDVFIDSFLRFLHSITVQMYQHENFNDTSISPWGGSPWGGFPAYSSRLVHVHYLIFNFGSFLPKDAYVILIDLVKSLPTTIWIRHLASIQPRTSIQSSIKLDSLKIVDHYRCTPMNSCKSSVNIETF